MYLLALEIRNQIQAFKNYKSQTYKLMKETILTNIDLSSQIIVFDQQTRQGQLVITNKHPSFATIFKIKATKLNIIQVKPAKGCIKPQSRVTINFKLSANMTQTEMETTENNDKFMIQFLNIINQEVSKEEIQSMWQAYKKGTANLEHGYGSYRVLMNLTGRKKLAVSDVKSRTSNSQMYKSVGRGLGNSQTESTVQKTINDDELSKKYTQLKEKEQQLLQQRQGIFKSGGTPLKSSKGGKVKTYIVYIIVFILAFMAGNYLRSSMVKVKDMEKIKEEKNSFWNFWNLFE